MTPSVLLVEDDPGVRNATRVFLKMEGYQVTAAASVAEAVRLASEAPQIDLIVTDYRLGNTETGPDAIAAVRRQLGRHIKAILVTGDMPGALLKVREDADLRITSKPIDADSLLGLMHEMLPH